MNVLKIIAIVVMDCVLIAWPAAVLIRMGYRRLRNNAREEQHAIVAEPTCDRPARADRPG